MQNINTKLLDEELAKLKAIGLKEISKSTKLASSKIEDVLEKRFDKIDKVRAKGFIAILEREYGVDLRDWILCQQQMLSGSVSDVSQVISKQDEELRSQKLIENEIKIKEKQKAQEIAKKQEEKDREHIALDLALKNKPKSSSDTESYTWLYVILVLVLLALMGYFAYKAFVKENLTPIESTHSADTQANASESENAYDGMFFDTTKPQAIQAQPLVETPTDSVKSQELEPSKSQPSTQSTTEQANNHPEQNFFFNPTNAEAQATQNPQQQNTQNDNVLHINADSELWLGVINLNDGTKEQFAYQKAYDIKLNGKMLFVMGHSNFTLTLNGEEIAHSPKHPVRMYYDGSSLVDVGYTRFKQLSGDLEW